MGKGSVNVPGPSAAEQALQSEQTALLREQRDIIREQYRQQQLLAPILFRQAGLVPTFDEQGKVTGFTESDDPLATSRREIEKGFLDRTLAAQRGELPVNPALLKDLGEQEATLKETLRKQLGPGFETSSPGIEALSKFGINRENILEGSRRGDLTLAESLGLARESSNENRINSFLARITGVNQGPLTSAGAFSGPVSGMSDVLSGMRADRGMQTQAALARAQNATSSLNSLMSGVGTLGGAALFASGGFGAPAAAANSIRWFSPRMPLFP